MSPFIGKDRNIDPEPLATMRNRGGTWAVYQNAAMDSAHCGKTLILKVGEGCTCVKAPERHPDTPGMGPVWKYLHVGYVDLETGLIVDEMPMVP